jgi:hypothetical protein
MIHVELHSEKHPGLVALVDDSDEYLIAGHVWRPTKVRDTFYAYTIIAGKTVYMHRMIMGAQPGQEIDHEGHDTLDNRRAKLRVATSSQNNSNKGISRANTSGYKGVSWDKQAGRWRASIKKDGKKRVLGLHDDPVVAARVYDAAARELHGVFAVVNFPGETWNVGVRPVRHRRPNRGTIDVACSI